MTFQGQLAPSKIVSRFRPSGIFGRQMAENEFARLGDSLNTRFLELNKVALASAKEAKITLHDTETTRTIAFPTSSKSLYGLGSRQKMNKQCHSTS
jgi:hypothetical protein